MAIITTPLLNAEGKRFAISVANHDISLENVGTIKLIPRIRPTITAKEMPRITTTLIIQGNSNPNAQGNLTQIKVLNFRVQEDRHPDIMVTACHRVTLHSD